VSRSTPSTAGIVARTSVINPGSIDPTCVNGRRSCQMSHVVSTSASRRLTSGSPSSRGSNDTIASRIAGTVSCSVGSSGNSPTGNPVNLYRSRTRRILAISIQSENADTCRSPFSHFRHADAVQPFSCAHCSCVNPNRRRYNRIRAPGGIPDSTAITPHLTKSERPGLERMSILSPANAADPEQVRATSRGRRQLGVRSRVSAETPAVLSIR
jgi:hypothetical protein